MYLLVYSSFIVWTSPRPPFRIRQYNIGDFLNYFKQNVVSTYKIIKSIPKTKIKILTQKGFKN